MAPVLKGKHWLISIGIGAAVFLAVYFVLPMVSANETNVIVTQSAIVGVVIAGFALILCYVLADARRHGFNRGVWFVVVLLLNLVGFIIYLIYSAAKTGDWKRATLPIAYIFEVIIVGVMVLVPLIYTEALPKAQLMTFLAAPPPPPPPPPPPAAAAPAPRIIHRVSAEDIMRAPTVIPKTIAQVKDEPEPAPNAGVGVVGGVPGGVPGGSDGWCTGRRHRRRAFCRCSSAPAPAEAASSQAHPGRRPGGIGEVDFPAQARVSAPRQDGAHSGHGAPGRDHQ